MGLFAIAGQCLKHHITHCKTASSRNASAEICSMSDYVPRVETNVYSTSLSLKSQPGCFSLSALPNDQLSVRMPQVTGVESRSENGDTVCVRKQSWRVI